VREALGRDGAGARVVDEDASGVLAASITFSVALLMPSYQSCVIRAATSRPPRPKASPKASEMEATMPMNRMLMRSAAMPSWLIATRTAKATMAISAMRPRSGALVNPMRLPPTSMAPRTKRARSGATSRMTAATIRLGIHSRTSLSSTLTWVRPSTFAAATRKMKRTIHFTISAATTLGWKAVDRVPYTAPPCSANSRSTPPRSSTSRTRRARTFEMIQPMMMISRAPITCGIAFRNEFRAFVSDRNTASPQFVTPDIASSLESGIGRSAMQTASVRRCGLQPWRRASRSR
jgi:hypothetical protein